MTHYEISFRLQHECPYNLFSKTHPGAVISHWCNWNRDVLEISHRDLKEKSLQNSVRELTRSLGTRIIRRSFARTNLQVVLQNCACDKLPPPTLPMIDRCNCLEVQPATYTDGWEWYRVIAFSERDIRTLFRKLGREATVEVTSRTTVSDESVRETFLVSTRSLFGKLTNRQAHALTEALDGGYYRVPRSASAGEIARRLGVPRTSFSDHLRKAEGKVLQAVEPYLRMRAS